MSSVINWSLRSGQFESAVGKEKDEEATDHVQEFILGALLLGTEVTQHVS